MKTVALIVAAGRGERARAAAMGPKQYAMLGDRTVVAHAAAAFLGADGIDHVLVAIHRDDHQLYDAAMSGFDERLLPPVIGGATRQASVLAGLEALAGHGVAKVLIHDAARPFVEAGVITRVLAALETSDGAIAALPVSDTLKQAGGGGIISATVPREGLWRAQTPQGFRFDAILKAHRAAAAAGRSDLTDDAAVAEWAGVAVALIPGSARNIKITTAEDLAMAAAPPGTAFETRTGSGFDVHRFTAGDHVWLCGVKIAHTAALEGHSDADVALHALTDAILGAIGDGDIGQHFPPSDPKWKGAASSLFLADASRRVAAAGGRIVNADITILCEAPRVGPHRDAMRARVAEILGIDISRVGVKATTTEGLGFTGRREGIVASAVASVALPLSAPTAR